MAQLLKSALSTTTNSSSGHSQHCEYFISLSMWYLTCSKPLNVIIVVVNDNNISQFGWNRPARWDFGHPPPPRTSCDHGMGILWLDSNVYEQQKWCFTVLESSISKKNMRQPIMIILNLIRKKSRGWFFKLWIKTIVRVSWFYKIPFTKKT